jgi:hypothetical protein
MTVRERRITDKDEWLNKWRPENVNSSEAGALFGISRCTPLQLYHRKLGDLPDEEETDAMRRGRWLEPAVIKAMQELRPDLTIWQPNIYFDDPELRVGCTPDAFATDGKGRKGVIQAKTVGQNVFEEWCENGEVHAPLDYQLQNMIEAIMTKRTDFALIGLMIVGWRVDMRILPVPVLNKTWDVYLKRVKVFWQNFEKRIAPEVSGMDGDLIRKLYPGQPDLTIDLSRNNRLPEMLDRHDELAAALKEGRAPLKPLEKAYDGVRTEIKGMMGDAEFAILPGGKVATLKEQTNKGWTARVLRIKDAKE